MKLFVRPHDPLLSSPSVVLFDSTAYAPDEPYDALELFKQRHLAGARFWNMEALAEPNAEGFLLMMPSPERFAKYTGSLGIAPETHVVVYDQHGNNRDSPRTVMTFKAFGHDKVSLLEGGLPRAVHEGVALEEGEPTKYESTLYPTPTLKPNFIIGYDEMTKVFDQSQDTPNTRIVLDTRPPEDLALGRLPNVYSIPYTTLLDKQPDQPYSTFLRPEQFKIRLREVVGEEAADNILQNRRPVTSTCLVGITACLMWISLQNVGVSGQVYDESWTGYDLRRKAK